MRTIHYVRDPRFQVRIVEHFFRLASSLKWVKSLPGSSSTHLGQAGMRDAAARMLARNEPGRVGAYVTGAHDFIKRIENSTAMERYG